MRGQECIVPAVPRAPWGLLCKLQWPFTAGVQQKRFPICPWNKFTHLFSLARVRPAQLSNPGRKSVSCSSLVYQPGKEKCVFSIKHLTS